MNNIQEFWYCVSSQENLPLHKGKSLKVDKYDTLIEFIKVFKTEFDSGKTAKQIIENNLLKNPNLLGDLRILVGVSDKRLYLDLTYIFNFTKQDNGEAFLPEKRGYLLKHNTTFFRNKLKNSESKKAFSKVISKYYLDKGMESILITFTKLSEPDIRNIFEYLVSPKEIQQKQAKYRGHGAEMSFAKVFNDLGMEFVPEKKHTDPMLGYDPSVDLSNMTIVKKDTKNTNIYSFDLVVYDNDKNIRILVQSLIHSSDPGQYGVNKSDETVAVKSLIDKYNESNDSQPVFLLGSVDGVGFSENPNGTIVKMLDVFDSFFQINTLFKIGLFLQEKELINNINCIELDNTFFDSDGVKHFKEKYIDIIDINICNDDISDKSSITAGKAVLVLD